MELLHAPLIDSENKSAGLNFLNSKWVSKCLFMYWRVIKLSRWLYFHIAARGGTVVIDRVVWIYSVWERNILADVQHRVTNSCRRGNKTPAPHDGEIGSANCINSTLVCDSKYKYMPVYKLVVTTGGNYLDCEGKQCHCSWSRKHLATRNLIEVLLSSGCCNQTWSPLQPPPIFRVASVTRSKSLI